MSWQVEHTFFFSGLSCVSCCARDGLRDGLEGGEGSGSGAIASAAFLAHIFRTCWACMVILNFSCSMSRKRARKEWASQSSDCWEQMATESKEQR